MKRVMATAVALACATGALSLATFASPSGSTTFAVSKSLAGPQTPSKIAFTDDRDQLELLDLDRTQPGTDSENVSGRVRKSGVSPAAAHAGEAAGHESSDYAYVSTEGDDRDGEVWIGEQALPSDPGPAPEPRPVTCDNTDFETHPVINVTTVFEGGLPWEYEVAYASNRQGDWDIFVASTTIEELGPDGSLVRALPTNCADWLVRNITADDPEDQIDDLWPAWLPDGSGIVYSSAGPADPENPESPDPLGDIFLHRFDDVDGDTVDRVVRSPAADTQPDAGLVVNTEGVFEYWLAFTTTRSEPAGSIALLNLFDKNYPITEPLPGTGTEAAWGGNVNVPYLAYSTTDADPYGDVGLARLSLPIPQGSSGAVSPQVATSSLVSETAGRAESHPAWLSTFSDARTDETGEMLITVRSRDADITDVEAADGTDRRVIVDRGEADGDGVVPFDEAGPSFSPDGKHIVYSQGPVIPGGAQVDGGRELVIAASDGTDPQVLTAGRESTETIDEDPTWSPDGQRIAFTRYVENGDGWDEPEIWVVDVSPAGVESNPRSVTFEPEGSNYADVHPSWSPDSTKLVISRGMDDYEFGFGVFAPISRVQPPYLDPELFVSSLWILDLETNADYPVRTPPPCKPLVECDDVAQDIPGRTPAWSPDGRTIVYNSRGALQTVVLATEPAEGEWEAPTHRSVTGFGGQYQDEDATPSRPSISVAEDPAWSPDGTEIAFAGQPAGQPDQRGIYAIKPDGTGLRPVTDDRGPETEPAWSPSEGADVAVDLTITGSPAAPGEPVTATYTIENAGDSRAVDVNLGTTFTAGGMAEALNPPAGCEVDGSGCSFGTMAPEDPPIVYEVTLTYPLPLEGVATGTVETTSEDINGENDSVEEPFTIQTVDLSVTVTLDEPVGYVGGQRTATVEVQNAGPEVAEGVTLAMTYPTTLITPQSLETCLNGGLVPCELDPLAPDDEPQSFQVPMEMIKDGTGLIVATVATDDATSDSAEVPIEVLQPTIRLLPAVGRPGQVVLAYAESMPPRSEITLAWKPGVTVAPGPYRVTKDGTMRASLLIIRRDLLGDRELIATSTEDLFTPVSGGMLVVMRPLMAPGFVGRG